MITIIPVIMSSVVRLSGFHTVMVMSEAGVCFYLLKV